MELKKMDVPQRYMSTGLILPDHALGAAPRVRKVLRESVLERVDVLPPRTSTLGDACKPHICSDNSVIFTTFAIIYGVFIVGVLWNNTPAK